MRSLARHAAVVRRPAAGALLAAHLLAALEALRWLLALGWQLSVAQSPVQGELTCYDFFFLLPQQELYKMI